MRIAKWLRQICIIRATVLCVLGILVLALAIGIQTYASVVRWSESKINAWAAKLTIDLSEERTLFTTFLPVVFRSHSARFTLRAPLRGDLAKYRGENKFLPREVTERSLAGKSFEMSWQLLRAGDVLAEGTVCASDLKAWARGDHVYYQRAWGLSPLEPGTQYSLVATIEQPNEAVNEFGPTLLVRTWGSLKGYPIAGCRLSDTALMALIGVALFAAALRTQRSSVKIRRRQTSSCSKAEPLTNRST